MVRKTSQNSASHASREIAKTLQLSAKNSFAESQKRPRIGQKCVRGRSRRNMRSRNLFGWFLEPFWSPKVSRKLPPRSAVPRSRGGFGCSGRIVSRFSPGWWHNEYRRSTFAGILKKNGSLKSRNPPFSKRLYALGV